MRLDFEAFLRTRPRSRPHTLVTCASAAPLLEFLSLRPSLPASSPSLPGALRSRRFCDWPSLSRSPVALVLSVFREKPDRYVSALPACSSFRAFHPHLRRTKPRRCPVPQSRDLVPILRVDPPPGCPRDVPPRRPRRNHHPVTQMMISVPSLSDPKHHPGTQMMSRLGISRPSPHGCPFDDFGRDSPRRLPAV
jgi:hypothetical protein